MCIVLSALLGALAVNFYLNGFLIQAVTTGTFALVFLIVMIRNIQCKKGGCKPDLKTKEENNDS